MTSSAESLCLNPSTRDCIEISTGESICTSLHIGHPNQESISTRDYYPSEHYDAEVGVALKQNFRFHHQSEQFKLQATSVSLVSDGQPIIGVTDTISSISAQRMGKEYLYDPPTVGESNGHHIIRSNFTHLSGKGDSVKKETYRDQIRFPIVRRPTNIKVSDSNVNFDYQHQNRKFFKIDLTLIGYSLEEILSHSWSPQEALEGRRIIRKEKEQQGCTLNVHFRVIRRGRMYSEVGKKDHSKYLEVSCIRFDHAHFNTTNYFITSVDVIGIVEFLVDHNTLNSALKWRERGRIRSNLAPLWFKNWSDMESMHLQFENLIRRVHSQNSCRVSKFARLLLWLNLEYALSKALLFYGVSMPIDYSPQADRDTSASREKW